MIGDIRSFDSFDLHRMHNADRGSCRLAPQSFPHAAVEAPYTSETPTRMLDRHGFKPRLSRVVAPGLLKARRPHAATVWKLDLNLHPARPLHSIPAGQIT